MTDDGRAIVHAERGRFEQLHHRAESLESLGQREQARWATIDSFDTVPLDLRVDAGWLQHFRTNELIDIIIELQPVLSRAEADLVLRAIADLLFAGRKTHGDRHGLFGPSLVSGKGWPAVDPQHCEGLLLSSVNPFSPLLDCRW